ncbi:hypothetical protein POVWA1_001340 [Plasmodium ovale wallikeri]|uniref:Uncharacterized protein n=1 Tax=Plasmodium ovale wallikeri TaxID=864142 RepID=A0A1A8YGU3_PLAOA|nr:hypothetical protein POVWA1_001340 [Plasmodium ovale wallikeri]
MLARSGENIKNEKQNICEPSCSAGPSTCGKDELHLSKNERNVPHLVTLPSWTNRCMITQFFCANLLCVNRREHLYLCMCIDTCMYTTVFAHSAHAPPN